MCRPLLLHALMQLCPAEAVALLRQDCESLLPRDERAAAVATEDWRTLHGAYVGLAYDTLGADARDDEELRTLTAAVWHPFIVPVLTGESESGGCLKIHLAFRR